MLNGSHGPIVLDKTKQGARPRPDAVTILTLYCVLLIAITGWAQDADKALSRAAGFDHHLTKPIEPETLIQLLDT